MQSPLNDEDETYELRTLTLYSSAFEVSELNVVSFVRNCLYESQHSDGWKLKNYGTGRTFIKKLSIFRPGIIDHITRLLYFHLLPLSHYSQGTEPVPRHWQGFKTWLWNFHDRTGSKHEYWYGTCKELVKTSENRESVSVYWLKFIVPHKKDICIASKDWPAKAKKEQVTCSKLLTRSHRTVLWFVTLKSTKFLSQRILYAVLLQRTKRSNFISSGHSFFFHKIRLMQI